jgi:hypothetical protein
MRRYLRLLPGLFILPLAVLVALPQLWRCQRIDQSDEFVRLTVGPVEVFVSRDTPPALARQLRADIARAQGRIRSFWGGQQGRATLIYCPSAEQYGRYSAGGEGAGASLGTPWGRSFVVLGPDGGNADVIAHELCHDELYARLGWWTLRRQVPQWFNEGLALLVDYRFTDPADPTRRFRDERDEWRFRSLNQQTLPALTDLESAREFFDGDGERVTLAYLTAGLTVSAWLTRNGPTAPRRLADALASGTDFGSAYRMAGAGK